MRGPCRGDRTARGRAAGAMDPADHGRCRDRRHRRPLPARMAHRGLVPRPRIRLPGRVPAVSHRRPAAAGHRHQRGDCLAHHGDDAHGKAGAGLRARVDVHRPGTRLPALPFTHMRPRGTGPARRCGTPRGPSRRLPRPKARPGSRAPGHAARTDTADQCGAGP